MRKNKYSPRRRTPPIERFYRHVGQPTVNGCRLWTGGTNNLGYGSFNYGSHDRGTVAAHRLAYEIANGPIPQGMGVLHKCDTPLCVNPDHLELGDQAKNMRDAVIRGRVPRGENKATAKLTDDNVVEIRRLAITGVPAVKIAGQYGVCERTVEFILAGKTWRHVPISVDEQEKLATRVRVHSSPGVRRKLTPDDVTEICKLVADGCSQTETAGRFGVHQSTVSLILSGKTHRDVPNVMTVTV